MKTYTFKVVVEPDGGGYHACCPALRYLGAVTQGASAEEALANINEVVQIIVDELRKEDKPLPLRLPRTTLRYSSAQKFDGSSHPRYDESKTGLQVSKP
jgi:predicted RNase H-like HicB family nuclease